MKFEKQLPLLFYFAILCYAFDIKAQKMDQIQNGSLWLNGFKADGDLADWPKPMKAYNHKMKMSYSIANDDKFLYLAVSTNRTEKIFYGGLSYIIKRADGTEGEIIFPYNPLGDPGRREFYSRGIPVSTETCNLIEVFNVSPITDSVISIYNEHAIQAGIKTAMKESKIYGEGETFLECEMAIPLNILGISPAEYKQLNYTLRMKGRKEGGTFVKHISSTQSKGRMRPHISMAEHVADYEKEVDAWTPVELSGEYVLSTKP